MVTPRNKRINFDANASYGLLPEVKERLTPLFGFLLNPSSIHRGGQDSKALIEESRESLRKILKLSPDDKIIFTSGATEANNTAIFSSFINGAEPNQDFECVVSAYEHPSVLEATVRLKHRGIKTKLISEISPTSALEAVSNKTRLFSLMVANNETGELFPVKEIASKLKELYPSLLIHTDGVQALGKLELDFHSLNVDMMSISAHKIGGLQGSGALIVRSGVPINGLLVGGPQEGRLRAGTENVLGIASFGIAARYIEKNFKARILKMEENTHLLKSILADVPDAVLVGGKVSRLPNTLSIRFPGVRADDLIVALDLEGILASSGAACASGKPEPSHVLLAMGLTPNEAREVLRLSVTAELSLDEIQIAATTIVRCVKTLQGIA